MKSREEVKFSDSLVCTFGWHISRCFFCSTVSLFLPRQSQEELLHYTIGLVPKTENVQGTGLAYSMAKIHSCILLSTAIELEDGEITNNICDQIKRFAYQEQEDVFAYFQVISELDVANILYMNKSATQRG